jgi:hypothetical protein
MEISFPAVYFPPINAGTPLRHVSPKESGGLPETFFPPCPAGKEGQTGISALFIARAVEIISARSCFL